MIMINRSLTYQMQLKILDQQQDMIQIGALEEEKAGLAIEPKITNAVIDEITLETTNSQGKPTIDINFFYLYLLVRAITNILFLESD